MVIQFEQNGLVGQIFSSYGSFSLIFLGATLSASLAGYVLYQLFFHPLAQYPGPFLGRITSWYDVYHSYIGDKHILLYQFHQKHGAVVRFAPNIISINDPIALKTIYAHGANARKSTFYESFRARPDAISTFLTTNIQDHARKRRVLSQAFSDTAMRGLEQHVVRHIEDFIDRIRKSIGQPNSEKASWSRPEDMSTWCTWLVFDIMGDLVFGRSFGTMGTKPENREGIYFLGRAARRNYTVAAMPSLIATGAEKFLPWLRGLYLDRAKYLAFGMRQVQERMREGGFDKMMTDDDSVRTDRKDIFTFLLRAKDPETGHGFSMGDLWMEGNTLIVAGSDSTSTSLAATLFYIIRNPTALARLTAEVRTAFANPEDIRTGPALHSCSFLRACIDETLRMTPPLGGILPREVMPGGLEIPELGLALPAGITIGVPVYTIQHDAKYVAEPFTWEPERWLPDGGRLQQDSDALHSVCTPFSVGRHACLGKPLVYMEISLAIARLLWEFDVRLAADQRLSSSLVADVRKGKRNDGEYHLMDWFMSRNEGPWVEIKPRA